MAKKNVKGAKGPTPHRESLVAPFPGPPYFFSVLGPACRRAVFVFSLFLYSAVPHVYANTVRCITQPRISCGLRKGA